MSSPSVLLIDDGELDDVRTLLAHLGTEFVHLRGGQIPKEVDPPRELFIATTRRALIAEAWPLGGASQDNPRKIAVVTEDSNTLRNRLRRAGFDLLIRRPVHPYALRLVLLRSLYSGAERRRNPRAPIGHPVRYRAGFRHRKAWIADLSLSGGRLLLSERLSPGTRISLQLPSGVTDGRSLTLRGKILRINEAESHSGGATFAAAIHFEKLSMAVRRRIFNILNDRAHGPSVLDQPVAMDLSPEPEATAPEAEGGIALAETDQTNASPLAAPGAPEDRRKDDRVSFAKEIAIEGEARQVLLGRNLSMGGMGIDPHPDLSVGDRLRLALYCEADEDPFVLSAEVLHEKDGAGLGLRFVDLEPGDAIRLEKLITHLPAVEPLQNGENDAMGAVVSRILDRETGEADSGDES